MVRRVSKYKASALKLFKEGVPPSEIAQTLGFSKSLLYRWIERERWTSPLATSSAPIAAISEKVQAGDSTGWVHDLLRTKLPDRFAELDELCKKGNVAAISLWFKLVGTPWKEAQEPTEVQVPTLVIDLVKPKNAEPALKLIAIPETPVKTGFVDDLSVPGKEAGR